MSYNKATIVGNLGRAPDLRHTKGGEPVATLGVATNRRWVDKAGEQHDEVEWHRVVVWGKQAEACGKYLRKGSTVLVEGRLQTRPWEDEKGIKRYGTEIVAHEVRFLDKKPKDRAPHPAEGEGGAS